MELKMLFEEFKACSLSILSILEKDDYDQLESKIDERQRILDDINKLTFTKEEITKVVTELKITELSLKINDLMVIKRNYLKTEIENTAAKKNANSKYNKDFYNNFHIFSKKV